MFLFCEILFWKEPPRGDDSGDDNSPRSSADRDKAEVCGILWTIRYGSSSTNVRIEWNKEYWNLPTCVYQYFQIRLKFTLQNRSGICWTSTLELKLDLSPSIVRELTLPDDVVNMNHFPGSKKNWDKQLEEDVDRGKKCEDGTDEDDDSALSWGPRWLGVLRGAIN